MVKFLLSCKFLCICTKKYTLYVCVNKYLNCSLVDLLLLNNIFLNIFTSAYIERERECVLVLSMFNCLEGQPAVVSQVMFFLNIKFSCIQL